MDDKQFSLLLDRLARILGLQQIRLRVLDGIVKTWLREVADEDESSYRSLQQACADQYLDREIVFMRRALEGKALLTREEEIAWLAARFQADDTASPRPPTDE